MGSGAFGSNGSVHWQVGHNDGAPPEHSAVDDKKHQRIGLGKGPGNDHEGAFRITARFKTRAQAEAALTRAREVFDKSAGSELVLDVHARPFDDVHMGPGALKNWEVTVDW
jgi:hypothetical protein